VPVSEIDTELFDALLAIERVAVALPVALGENVTFQVAPLFTSIVIGRLGPSIEKSVPVVTTLEIETEDAPLLIAESVRVLLLPTTTLAKARVETLIARLPGSGC